MTCVWVLLLAAGFGRAADEPFRSVTVAEFAKLVGQPDTVVLDVRSPREFQAGRIKGAVNLNVNAPDFDAAVAKLDKGKTYLVLCASGVRSVKACKKMAQLNFPKLVNLSAGMMGWEKAGQPVEK